MPVSKYCPDCKSELQVDCTDAVGLVTSWRCIACGMYWKIGGFYHSDACNVFILNWSEGCNCKAYNYREQEKQRTV